MVFDKIIMIGAMAIVLYWLMPLVNTFRLSTLALGGHGIVMTFILMMLIPIIWIIFVFTSIITLKKAIEGRNSEQ